MMRSVVFQLVVAVGTFSGIFAGSAAASALPPIWIPAVGTPITSWDSQSSGVGLKTVYFPSTFTFSLFGETYTSVTVSSNGSLYFDSTPAATQPQATVPLLLQGLPRIAAAWYSTDVIDGNGAVYYNMVAGQAVFTFDDVAGAPPPQQSAPPSSLATFQLILDSDGTIILAYDSLNSLDPASTGVVNSLVGSSQAIIGVTDGYGATNPGSTDLSGLGETPGFSLTTTSNTVYQLIGNNPPDNSNLAGLDLIFTPAVSGGWIVTSEFPSTSALPSGVPEPRTLVQMFLALSAFMSWRFRKLLFKKKCADDTH
jgi:hypothetical protein